MALRAGIVGLPNAGKSTLFNAITAAGAAAEDYPFTTIEPNVGVVEVPDPRLDRLYEILDVPGRVPAVVEIVDIAGLVKGAHRGEGLGNRFLAHIREVDAVIHVVRCFEQSNLAHPEGSVEPARDVSIVETELALADLDTVEKRLDRVAREARSGAADAEREHELLERLRDWLGAGRPARTFEPGGGRADEILGSLFLLTRKPILYVANVAESGLDEGDGHVAALRSAAGDGPVLVLCCELEAELLALEANERAEYMRAVGLDAPGIDKLVRSVFSVLGLITFFTFNENEVRAWSIPRGTRAPEAAGAVHSDFESGFIRAETISFDEFERVGSMKEARDQGRVRAEGRDYVVQDGDILLFRAAA